MTDTKPDLWAPLTTEAQAIHMAGIMRDFTIERGAPLAMEVVRLAKRTKDGSIYLTQPKGMHLFYKTHTLIHTAELP